MLSRLKLWALVGLAFVLALIGIRVAVLTDQRDKAVARARELSQYKKIRKAVDDEVDQLGNDPDAARRWLREHSQQ